MRMRAAFFVGMVLTVPTLAFLAGGCSEDEPVRVDEMPPVVEILNPIPGNQAIVQITLTDGTVLEGRCETQPRGEFDEPLEPDALENKFKSLVSPRIGDALSNRLWSRLLELEKEQDFSEVVTWLRREVCPVEKSPSI